MGPSKRKHRTCIAPLGIVRAEAIENADAPPPLGSTATKKCMTLSLPRSTRESEFAQLRDSGRVVERIPVVAVDPDEPLRLALFKCTYVIVPVYLFGAVLRDEGSARVSDDAGL